MKALIVEDDLAGHPLDLSGKLIIVPEADNLAISLFDFEVLAWQKFKIAGNCRVIREIEIPDAIVQVAMELVQAKEKILQHKDAIKALCV